MLGATSSPVREHTLPPYHQCGETWGPIAHWPYLAAPVATAHPVSAELHHTAHSPGPHVLLPCLPCGTPPRPSPADSLCTSAAIVAPVRSACSTMAKTRAPYRHNHRPHPSGPYGTLPTVTSTCARRRVWSGEGTHARSHSCGAAVARVHARYCVTWGPVASYRILPSFTTPCSCCTRAATHAGSPGAPPPHPPA